MEIHSPSTSTLTICFYVTLLRTLVFTDYAEGFSSGPPTRFFPAICESMSPSLGHGPSAIPSNIPTPYRITLNQVQYRPGEPLQVTLDGQGIVGISAQFRGFFMQARRIDTDGNVVAEPIGTFSKFSSFTGGVLCNGEENSAWGHVNSVDKQSVTATWTPPAVNDEQSNVVFQATVVQGPTNSFYYEGLFSDEIMPQVGVPTTTNPPSTAGPTTANQPSTAGTTTANPTSTAGPTTRNPPLTSRPMTANIPSSVGTTTRNPPLTSRPITANIPSSVGTTTTNRRPTTTGSPSSNEPVTPSRGGIFEDVKGVCGTRSEVRLRLQPRIFNGRDAALGSWPWVGRIDVTTAGGFYCVAVLIDTQYALTLPECEIQGNETVVFGETGLPGSSPCRQEVGMRRHDIHPDWVSFTQFNMEIIQLATPVNITDCVRPICLTEIANEWETLDNCWIAGWGAVNAFDDFVENLQEAPSNLLPTDQCDQILAPVQLPRHETWTCGVQGGNREPRVCALEAGAPMMCYGEDNRWYLTAQNLGVVGACGNNTSVFILTAPYLQYIENHVRRIEECVDPDYRCQDEVTCVLKVELCDGQEHCPDDDDEDGCPVLTCTNSTCLNGGVCQENAKGYVCECREGWSGPHCEMEMVDVCGPSSIFISPGSSVMTTSPLYPENYPDLTVCEYTVSTVPGLKIVVEFVDFGLETGFDYLYVEDRAFTGGLSDVPETSMSAASNATIRFESDNTINARGFLLILSTLNISGINECKSTPCQNGGTCFDEDDGYRCECTGIWIGKDCREADNYCGPTEDIVLDEGSSYNLTSFHYDIENIYGVSYRCRYTVEVPLGRRVRVKFLGLGLVGDYDALFLGTQVFNGFQIPKEDYLSENNMLEIIYVTRGAPGTRGYKLIVSDYLEPDGDECASQPCQNGAQCHDNEKGFTCKCRRGFTGPTCKIGISHCEEYAFLCSNGRCIKPVDVCDGRNHCGDGSDEIKCGCDFYCHNGRCIPERYVCDKKNNCGDWSDEHQPNC